MLVLATLLFAPLVALHASDIPAKKTAVTIVGEDFYINGQPTYEPPILRPDRVSDLIRRVHAMKSSDGRTLLVGTSFGGCIVPTTNVVAHRTSCSFTVTARASRKRSRN